MKKQFVWIYTFYFSTFFPYRVYKYYMKSMFNCFMGFWQTKQYTIWTWLCTYNNVILCPMGNSESTMTLQNV